MASRGPNSSIYLGCPSFGVAFAGLALRCLRQARLRCGELPRDRLEEVQRVVQLCVPRLGLTFAGLTN
ncbi:hypothetical protein DUNSADRAFT_16600 [Dunaliella salina]|uniref:Encoded protein n=1 Tax=Dunaliella salina TaxID=3046 RepID=A0ABQ7G3B1_DUNSA|nr:hypothetical protein DUNSADRAFT_16600 [Dunaliella salina]|eukprot:KAF5829087.1 hypothetical protein DUNSADRAFT_16600 [Dunaliella salina]